MADLSDLLNGLEVRAPWLSAGRPILKRAGFVIARGYKKTIRHALTEDRNDVNADLLRLLLLEHLAAGQKKIYLLKLKRGELSRLRDWALSKRRTVNELTDSYPGVAPNATVRTYMSGGIYSLGYCELECGVSAIFTSAKSYIERVQIAPSQLRASAADAYEKIVGYKRNYFQAYDAIWLPERGDIACISLDSPLGVPIEFTDGAYAALSKQIRLCLGRSPETINLWPAVDSLYKSNEGKLVDYGFVVGGRQVNHHKARRNTGDLRKAIYDMAGSAAVGDDLQPFKIAIQWTVAGPSETNSYPELLLPGVAGDANKAMPDLRYAFLRDGLTSRDLNFVISKLLSHLP